MVDPPAELLNKLPQVRVRPENPREKAGHYANVINVLDDRVLVFDPKEEQDDFYFQGECLWPMVTKC